MGQLLAVALLLGLLGFLLLVLARRGRGVRGLGKGKTISLDNQTLFSSRLHLVGRPDRIVREGKKLIPEEWKSSNSKRVNQGHRLQLGAYFLLIEEEFKERPSHGFVVLGDGSRFQVENTEKLRSEVLAIAQSIREHREKIWEEIPVRQPAAKCGACGQQQKCRQFIS